jgi:hypothetical protein
VRQSDATGRMGEGPRLDEMEEWEKDVPADLRPAVAHSRESFAEAHFACGEATRRFCYAALHEGPPDDPTREYFRYLMAMKRSVGPLRSQHFAELTNSKALPAVFKGYFDLYVDRMSAQVLVILRDLISIGRANKEQLSGAALPWAEAQAKRLISSHRHQIKNWVQSVCDVQVHAPGDDPEETVFWRSWRAPSLIIMTPCGRLPYEAEKVWLRYPPETSARWLEAYANQYVLNLGIRSRSLSVAPCLKVQSRHPCGRRVQPSRVARHVRRRALCGFLLLPNHQTPFGVRRGSSKRRPSTGFGRQRIADSRRSARTNQTSGFRSKSRRCRLRLAAPPRRSVST